MVYLQCCLVVTRLVPHKTVAVSVHSAYTIQPCAMSRHLMQVLCDLFCFRLQHYSELSVWGSLNKMGGGEEWGGGGGHAFS